MNESRGSIAPVIWFDFAGVNSHNPPLQIGAIYQDKLNLLATVGADGLYCLP
jgi:hypothetical protein